MTLQVTGIETIELSDPKGFCARGVVSPRVQNPSPQVGYPPGVQNPSPTVFPIPQVPTPITPPWTIAVPSTGDEWEKYHGIFTTSLNKGVSRDTMPPEEFDAKWGKGLTGATEPPKWEKNWQSKMSPEQMRKALGF